MFTVCVYEREMCRGSDISTREEIEHLRLIINYYKYSNLSVTATCCLNVPKQETTFSCHVSFMSEDNRNILVTNIPTNR